MMGNSEDEKTQGELSGIESESKPDSLDFDVASTMFSGEESEDSGRKIGRYRLLHPIGEGGMGVVWKAIQEHPVKRDVALKLVRDNLGQDALTRFEAERQAIAMMDHPNIAKILDADTTEAGTPYFVMELVKGIPLDQYCNNRKLDIEQRLRLMLPVCRAVQHAHQKAIIHRDLKHSNILVTENDDEAIPKVIDFGLAKALGSQKVLTDKTVFTEFGKVVGTIYYMSPEQAASDGMDIDTRSDIYSLGVVLYKLLTGRTPVQMEGDEMSVIGAIKVIIEKDPIAPSVAVRNSSDSAKWITENTPSVLDPFAEQLNGDIDSIILKALEKDRRSRYETANGMAQDIERYLNNEPVLAQPRSTVYSIKKFVQRNRGLVISLATIMALLVGGIVATTLALMLANKETARANVSAKHAKNETARANVSADLAKKEAARAKTAEIRAKDAEKLKGMQLYAQRHKSAWSDWENNNTQSAWQTLRQIEAPTRSWTSRYLANEMYTCKPEDSLHGHAHYVLSVDVSSQGDFFLSGGADDTVYLWNAKTKEKIYRRVFNDMVVCVRFSRDQQYFAVADYSNVVSIFNTQSGERTRILGPFEQDVLSLSFHPQKPVLAMGFLGNDSIREVTNRKRQFTEAQPADVLLVDVITGNTLQKIEGHMDEVTSLEFSGDGDLLASGCMDGKLRIWELGEAKGDDDQELKYELRSNINAHPMGVRRIDLSEDGAIAASCGDDKVACIWDVKSETLKALLAAHTSKVIGIDLSPSGKLVATSSDDHTAIVWDFEGNSVATWQGHTGPINEVNFTVDEKQIITASDDQTLRLWSTEPAGTSVSYDFGDTNEVWKAVFSPDQTMVATAGENGIVALIDASTGELKRRLPHGVAVLSVAWLSDGRLITGGDRFGLWVWDRLDRADELLEPQKKVYLSDSEVWDISPSPNGERLVVACSDGLAKILDSKTFEEQGVLRGHKDVVASARYSPDGKKLVTASDDGTVQVWDADTFEHLTTLEGHQQPVWRALFSPTDSNLIASSAANGEIILWDLAKSTPLPVSIEGHTTHVAGLTFSADGRNLVSASDDGTVRIWDVETGVELFVFQSQPASLMLHASFSKDGQSLATAGVGMVQIRHASSEFATPYLNRDAIAETFDSVERVRVEEATEAELEEIVKAAEKICRFYPTIASFGGLGAAQYRLGRYAEAVDSLEEAIRLEKILYGESDIRPELEAYLGLSLVKIGNVDRARELQDLLDRKAEHWIGDATTEQLQDQLRAAIGE
jgi:WD40 repeat protein/serine/threonine protein kinase